MQPHTEHDDLYRVLDVHPAASAHEIRLAYRKRVMIWHPDRNGRPDAAEKFKRVRSAYEVLRDPRLRAEYDREAAARAPRPRTHPDRSSPAAAAQPAAPGMADVRRRVQISLDMQLHGGRVELKLSRAEYCTDCGGSGASGTTVECAPCRGSGQARSTLGFFPFFLSAAAPCADCGGQGIVPGQCAACNGTGTLPRRRGRLRFDIPPGVPPGGSLRIPGHGRRSRGGNASGDLLIEVALVAHPLFTPDFPHLRCDMPVSIFAALAGGMIDVPTLDRPIAVRLPADVVDGTELRLAGHGMMNGANGKRGDLLVRLRMVRPPKLSAAQRELLARLEQLAADEPLQAAWTRRLQEAERLKKTASRPRKGGPP